MKTIKILRGDRAGFRWALESYVRCESLSPDRVFIEQGLNNVVTWYGIRKIMAEVEGRYNISDADTRILDVLSISSIMGNQSHEHDSKYASLKSNLSQNYFLQQPLYLEVEKCILNIFEKLQHISIIIPEIGRIDTNSLSILISVLKKSRSGIDLILGIEPKYNDTWLNSQLDEDDSKYDFDENGLFWNTEYVGIKRYILGLLALGGEIVDFEIPQKLAKRASMEDDWAAGFEDARIFKAIREASDLSNELVLQAYFCIKRAFHLYDFKTCLNFGRHFLENVKKVEPEIKAEISAMLGLSAHNSQFASNKGNVDTNSFIEGHNLKALEYYSTNEDENNREFATFILYRMAVLYARRMKEFEKGMLWADKCLTYSEKSINRRIRDYNTAWAYNIRAYVHFRENRILQASNDMDRSIESLEGLALLYPQSRDVNFSRSVILDNTSALYGFLNDLDRVKAYLIRSAETDGYQYWSICMNNILWIKIHRELLRTDLIIEEAVAGLEAAKQILRVAHQNYYISYLLLGYFRLGEREKFREVIMMSMDFFSTYRANNQKAEFLSDAMAFALELEEIELSQSIYLELEPISDNLDKPLWVLYKAREALLLGKIGKTNEAVEMSQQIFAELEEFGDDNLSLVTLSVVRDLYLMIEHGDLQSIHDLLFRYVIENLDEDNCFYKIKALYHGAFLDEELVINYIIPVIPSALKEDSYCWRFLPETLRMILDFKEVIQKKTLIHSELISILCSAYQRDDCSSLLSEIFRDFEQLNLEGEVIKYIENTSDSCTNFIENRFSELESRLFEEY